MTVSEQVPIVQEEGAVQYTAGSGIQRADVHPGAREHQRNTALQKVTDSDTPNAVATVQEKAQQAADEMAERVKAKFAGLTGGPSLLHAHPPTLAQRHQRAQECAAHHTTPLMSFLCLTYRYLHMGLIKFPCHVLEWCTDSFPKLLVTATVVFIAIHWI